MPETPHIGDFISVPVWQAFGCVMAVEPARIGPDGSIEVLLQEHPDQPARKWRRYRLAPGSYMIYHHNRADECPTHALVDELLAALKDVIQLTERWIPESGSVAARKCEIFGHARSLLRRARGEA